MAVPVSMEESPTAAHRLLLRLKADLAACRRAGAAAGCALDAAIRLNRSDFGSVQLYDGGTGSLLLSGTQGFGSEFRATFARVAIADGSVCARAMEERRMVFIDDVMTDPDFLPYRSIAQADGFRACVSTPLISRRGDFVGMVSVHFRQPGPELGFDVGSTYAVACHAADRISSLI